MVRQGRGITRSPHWPRPNIETKRERIAAVIRAVVRAQAVLRQDPVRATAVMKTLFPPVEAELMGHILARDAEFYQPSIATEAIDERPEDKKKAN
jgi:ABC-type nitrate/sulfonate/bicarbonate transport system substrate-binding protein